MELRTDDTPRAEWTFPAPLGKQAVLGEFTMADSLTISRHLRTSAIRSFITVAAIDDLSDPDGSPPVAIDGSGRSSQTFLVEVVVRRAGMERRAVARGRDIYAITAPLVVEAARRVLDGQVRSTGALTAGEAFDARGFLQSLGPSHLCLAID